MTTQRTRERDFGLHGTQVLATLSDGITRHSPEGRWFQDFSAEHGFAEAVRWRDSGRWIPNGGGPVPTAEEIAADPTVGSTSATWGL